MVIITTTIKVTKKDIPEINRVSAEVLKKSKMNGINKKRYMKFMEGYAKVNPAIVYSKMGFIREDVFKMICKTFEKNTEYLSNLVTPESMKILIKIDTLNGARTRLARQLISKNNQPSGHTKESAERLAKTLQSNGKLKK